MDLENQAKHILPYDNYPHIEDYSCECRPELTTVGSENVYIHNDMDEDE